MRGFLCLSFADRSCRDRSHNDTCLDGTAPKYYKSASAYSVAEPGDVGSMQQEIMTNGPIEVAFYVYVPITIPGGDGAPWPPQRFQSQSIA